MGLGYERIQVHSANLILSQYDDMERRKLFNRVGIRRTELVQLTQRMDIPLLQHIDEPDEYLRGGTCIVHGTVMVLKRDVQRLGNDVQLEFGQRGQQYPGHGYRIYRCKVRYPIHISAVLLYEPDIKSGVVRHEGRIPDKFQELRQCRLNRGRIHDHLVRDTRKLCDAERNRHLRIDKSAELICNPASLYLHCSDFDNLIFDRTESCRLKVKYDERIIKRLSLFIHRDIGKVVHEISFHPVYDLKRVLFVQRLNIMVGVRECLHHAVVRDGDRFMSPVMRPFYEILHFRHSIHIAHLGMAVKLHPLLRRGVLS